MLEDDYSGMHCKNLPGECFAYTMLYQVWWKNTPAKLWQHVLLLKKKRWDSQTEHMHTPHIHMLSLDFFTSCQLHRVISRLTRTYIPTHNICMHTTTPGCPPPPTARYADVQIKVKQIQTSHYWQNPRSFYSAFLFSFFLWGGWCGGLNVLRCWVCSLSVTPQPLPRKRKKRM